MATIGQELLVKIGADWVPGDKVQVFWDDGTGTVDTSRPLLNQPVNPFPTSLAPFREWLRAPWLRTTYLGNSPKGGLLKGRWLEDPWLKPVFRARIRVDLKRSDGQFLFAVAPVDEAGNPSSPTSTEFRANLKHPLGVATNITRTAFSSTKNRVVYTYNRQLETTNPLPPV